MAKWEMVTSGSRLSCAAQGSSASVAWPGGERTSISGEAARHAIDIDMRPSTRQRQLRHRGHRSISISKQTTIKVQEHPETNMASACATCASSYGSPESSLSEKHPLPGRHLPCCGRSICSRCLNQNKRYETYCPYCQITTEPSLLPQGLKDPPAYSSIDNKRNQPPPSNNNGNNNDEEPPAYTSHAPLQPPPEKHQQPAEDVLHFLKKDDTLSSLSLAYKVPLPALRKANNLYADHLLQGRKTVIIPGEFYKGGVSLSPEPVEGEEEDLRKRKLRRFQVAAKVAE